MSNTSKAVGTLLVVLGLSFVTFAFLGALVLAIVYGNAVLLAFLRWAMWRVDPDMSSVWAWIGLVLTDAALIVSCRWAIDFVPQIRAAIERHEAMPPPEDLRRGGHQPSAETLHDIAAGPRHNPAYRGAGIATGTRPTPPGAGSGVRPAASPPKKATP